MKDKSQKGKTLAYAVLHIRSLPQKLLGVMIGILVSMQMDIQFRIRSLTSHPFFSRNQRSSSSSSSHSSPYSPLKSFCSRRGSGESQENGDNNNRDIFSTDWDKAWSNFKKKGRKSLFSQFSPDKYVSWNPRRTEFPISEEIDPIKRTERSNLMLWTSPGFTLVGAIIIVSFLLLYTILAPIK